MTVEKVWIAPVIAVSHWIVTAVVAMLVFTTSPQLVSGLFLFAYVGLSAPVLAYRWLDGQPLGVDLLSWKTEVPINSIVIAALFLSVWFVLDQFRAGRAIRLLVITLVVFVFMAAGWFFARGTF